jgi:hypothetical protein
MFAGSRYHFLRSRTHSGRYHGCRVPFSWFALPDSSSAVPRALGPILIFGAPRLVWGCTEGVGPRFHVLRSRAHFGRYRGRRVPFSCLALPDSVSTVPKASGPVFMFSTPGLVFGGNVGVGSCFHVLRSQTHLGRYQGRRVPFLYFALSDSFSAVPRALGPVFHLSRSNTRFGRYRGRQVSFSCFALPDSF